ncbi:MAG: hypothetical protein QOD41_1239, partial [Cryptosporangiaceae bacterium]|nr:hypothetical protein [Cryptosporangiaceae bacterium]
WALSSRRLAAVTACVLAAAVMTADPASAAGGVLGGVVTDATTGAPVADVQVSVLKIVTDHGGQTTQVVTSVNTDADGRYSATGIPAGTAYKVELSRDGYVDEYSHDQHSPFDADDVTVPGTLNEALTPAGQLTGTITDETGAPATSGYVGAAPLFSNSLATFGSATVGTDGTYTMTGLVPGRYQVSISTDGRPDQYLHGTYDQERAAAITVATGPNTQNEQLLPKPSGIVTGTVTDNITKKPLKGICVEFQGRIHPATPGASCTGADGRYQFTGVAGQPAYLTASDRSRVYVSDEKYPVQTADAQTLVKDIAMERAGQLSATMVDAVTGKVVGPAGGVCLDAGTQDPAGPGQGVCPAKADGKVLMTGLKAGAYTLMVDVGGTGRPGSYGIGWVKRDGTTTPDKALARVVTVVSGKTTAAGNVKLAKSATISGVVTDKVTKKPIKDVCVGVGTYSTHFPGFSILGACTDAAGKYSLGGLGPGGWPLQIVSGDTTHAWVFSGGAVTRDKATKVTATAGKTTAYSLALAPGTATLAGTYSGKPSDEYYDLDVVNAVTGDYVQGGGSGVLTGGSAAYKVTGIAPQQVKINYDGGSKWYGGTDFKSAKAVTLVPGTTTIDLTTL